MTLLKCPYSPADAGWCCVCQTQHERRPMATDYTHPTDRPTPERMFLALRGAWADLSHWVQLAKRQREVIPNPDHCPHAPSADAIAFTELVMAEIGGAMAAFRKQEDGKTTVESRPECIFNYCPNKGGCPDKCRHPATA